MTTNTRERIVDSSAELFRRQGYAATGVKQIVTEAIRSSGAIYELLIGAVFDPAPDLVTGVRTFFAGAAEHLRETDYADACPIATVALEVSSSSETMRQACADVFASWITAGTGRHAAAGLSEAKARELTIAMLAALEGAFVLARALRSLEPLQIAGELIAACVQRALDDPAPDDPALDDPALHEA